VDELGSRKEVEYAFCIMRDGTSADRQLATYERTGDLKAVVNQLIAETAEGVRPSESAALADTIIPDHAAPPVTHSFLESQAPARQEVR
jgi:glutamate---cysteine ligase / carboxylate-amine ligase